MLRMSSLALALVVSATAIVPNVEGADPTTDPLIHEWTGVGSQWLTARLQVGEGRAVIFANSRDAPEHGVGTALFSPDGTLLYVNTYTGSGVRLPAAHAQAGPAGNAEELRLPVESPFGTTGIGAGLAWGYGVPSLPPGEYVAAFWSGAPEASHRFEVRGTAPVTVLATGAGPEAYLLTARHFEGTASVGAAAALGAAGVGVFVGPIGPAGVGARAQVDTSVAFDAASRMIGRFGPWQSPSGSVHTGLESLEIQHPNGAVDCSRGCKFDITAPGTWTLRATGVAVGTPSSAQIAFTAADLRFP